jgi:hypothetical protein
MTHSLLLILILTTTTLAQTPPPLPNGPLGEINNLFLAEYTARINDLTQTHPLYIEVSGNSLILHRNGLQDTQRVLPPIYHAFKEVSHIPFLLYLRLSPLTSTPQLSESQLLGLETLYVKINAARDALSTVDFNGIQIVRQQQIIDRSLALLRTTIDTKRIPRPTLLAFTHSIAPLLLLNADDAACYAIQGMHTQMMSWKTHLTSDEWSRIVVINPGVIQPRYRNLATQYFAWLFPAPAPPWAYPGENQRVIYSEFQHPRRDTAEVLASFDIDAYSSTAFFNNKWRLSEDLLSNGAAKCLARIPTKDRLWHP